MAEGTRGELGRAILAIDLRKRDAILAAWRASAGRRAQRRSLSVYYTTAMHALIAPFPFCTSSCTVDVHAQVIGIASPGLWHMRCGELLLKQARAKEWVVRFLLQCGPQGAQRWSAAAAACIPQGAPGPPGAGEGPPARSPHRKLDPYPNMQPSWRHPPAQPEGSEGAPARGGSGGLSAHSSQTLQQTSDGSGWGGDSAAETSSEVSSGLRRQQPRSGGGGAAAAPASARPQPHGGRPQPQGPHLQPPQPQVMDADSAQSWRSTRAQPRMQQQPLHSTDADSAVAESGEDSAQFDNLMGLLRPQPSSEPGACCHAALC